MLCQRGMQLGNALFQPTDTGLEFGNITSHVIQRSTNGTQVLKAQVVGFVTHD